MALQLPTFPALRVRLMAALTFVAAAIATPAILLISGHLLASEFSRSEELREDVYQSYRRRAQLQTVLSQLQDLEIGERGYVLTGKARFLEPQVAARARIQRELAALEPVFRSEPGQQRTLGELQLLALNKMAAVDRTIALQRRGHGDEAAGLLASGSEKRIMDRIRAIITQIDDAERAQLDHRVQLSKRAGQQAVLLSRGLHILLLLLLTAAALLINRTLSARRRALARVEELGVRHAAILEGAREGLVILDGEGTVESVNPAAAAMYDFAQEDLVGLDVGVLFEMNLAEGQGETFRTRRPAAPHSTLVHELWGRRRDGRVFPIDVSISPIMLEDATLYLAIIRDVSERKQMEQMKDEFVSTVSHELRTPLTSIAGSLGLIAGGAAGTIPDRAMRLIEIARSNSERLVRLINDILDIEKIESGAIELEAKPLLLKPVLEEAIEANRAFAFEHGVTIALAACPEDACALADADGLTQVITNLVSNAAKFSPDGKRVRVTVSRSGDNYRVTVADRGPGIPQEFRSRIFEKFAQADSSHARKKGGTGLGLSIAREIVVRLGGTISFEDRPGGGTCFHVDLRAAEPASAASASDGAAEGIQPRILHVDDDPLIRRLVAKAFNHRADVQFAPTLAAARAFLAEGEFDLAILDITLPDGSGLSLLPELHKAGQATPVILFSARDLENPVASEAEAVIPKSQATIEQLVETAIGLMSPLDKKAA